MPILLLSGASIGADGFQSDLGAQRLGITIIGGRIIADDPGFGDEYEVTLTADGTLVEVEQAGNAAFAPCPRDLARLCAALESAQ